MELRLTISPQSYSVLEASLGKSKTRVEDKIKSILQAHGLMVDSVEAGNIADRSTRLVNSLSTAANERMAKWRELRQHFQPFSLALTDGDVERMKKEHLEKRYGV